MIFLLKQDLDQQIRAEISNAITGSNDKILDKGELAAIDEMVSYLSNRYDIAKIFAPIYTWSAAGIYAKDTRIVLTAPAFTIASSYLANQLCVYQSIVYKANANLTPAVFEPANFTSVAPDYTLYYVIQAVTVAGQLPTDTTFYSVGDTRNNILVTYLIDMMLYHIHSRLPQRNIPELRITRYEAAIEWLSKVAANKLSPILPILEDQTGGLFLGSSNPKTSRRW